MSKIRVDMADLTLGELVDAEELLGKPLAEVGQTWAVLATVCIIQRRTDPNYSLDQARGLHMRDIELVSADPEAPADGNGSEPVLSPASGISTPST